MIWLPRHGKQVACDQKVASLLASKVNITDQEISMYTLAWESQLHLEIRFVYIFVILVLFLAGVGGFPFIIFMRVKRRPSNQSHSCV